MNLWEKGQSLYGHEACGILTPLSEIDPSSSAMKTQSPKWWIARQF